MLCLGLLLGVMFFEGRRVPPRSPPPEEHFEEHPECYSLQGGVRTAKLPSQLCLTNPDVIEIATEVVLEHLRGEARGRGVEAILVAQNDHAGYCECEQCSALEAQRCLNRYETG